MKRWLPSLLLLLLGTALALETARPTLDQAIGDLTRATSLERAAYENDVSFFQPLRKPGLNDWLAHHDEPGQTVRHYRLALPALKPRPPRTTLCVLPLGKFEAGNAPPLDKLREYCATFFGMPARMLDPVEIDQVPAQARINNGTRKRQMKAEDILAWLDTQKPKDAYALIAVTMEDLYPNEQWNFVFGQARLQGGTGVFSFARYDPAFEGKARDAQTEALIFKRGCKVLSHEMGHMFGLMHCVFFECLMNGSNHLAETDDHPMHLCPVCLRKLQLGTGLDLIKREESLKLFYESNALKDEAEWSGRRLEKLRKFP